MTNRNWWQRGNVAVGIWGNTKSYSASLLRENGGNVMWITAISLFPMLAMIGAGVDMARFYAAKTRLQQACDAGILAARKSMANSGSLNDTAKAEGQRMFAFNFPNRLFESQNTSFTPAAIDGSSTEISGTASTTMPATIMRMFKFGNNRIDVSCNARLEVSNVDIVFVLDTTGSMLDKNYGDTQDRMTGMRNAVMSFFDTIMQARTPNSRIRIGVVPFSQNVNVGKLLVSENSNWVASSAEYQSRQLNTAEKTVRGVFYPATYNYKKLTSPSLSGFKTGSTFIAPLGSNGSNITVPAWEGCIEELPTVAFSSGASVPANANDLNLKFVPSGSNVWKPAIPRLTYARPRTKIDSSNLSQYADVLNTTVENVKNFEGTGTYAACPSQAMRLKEMTKTDRSSFELYIKNLAATGGTYLDIGMIWGGRWIAPVGIFADDNKRLPTNGLPQSRHVIFMTDGEMLPNAYRYSAYGVEPMDRRVTGGTNSTSDTELKARHLARFSAACSAVKKDGQATLWVVGFGDEVTLGSNLQNCATSGLAFKADSSAQLEQKFKEIAQRITFLRLSQ